MEPSQRIKFLVDILFDGNQAAFSKKIGAKAQTISNLISRKSKPSFGLIESILQAFPELNADWLILGKGDVGLSTEIDKYGKSKGMDIQLLSRSNVEDHPSISKDEMKDVEKLLARIRSLEREIELLKDNVESQHETIKAKNLLIEHFQKLMS